MNNELELVTCVSWELGNLWLWCFLVIPIRMYVQSSQGINYLRLQYTKNYCVSIIYEAKRITQHDHLRGIELFYAFFTWHSSNILLEIYICIKYIILFIPIFTMRSCSLGHIKLIISFSSPPALDIGSALISFFLISSFCIDQEHSHIMRSSVTLTNISFVC